MSHPAAAYRAAEESLDREIGALDRRMRRVEAARLTTFVFGSLLGLLWNDLGVPPVAPATLSAILLGIFAVMVVRHRRLKLAWRRAGAARSLARMGECRLRRDWPGLHIAFDDAGYDDPLLDPPGAATVEHAYLNDLDIFGPASIRALLGPTPTPTGVETLRRWLSAPAKPSEIQRRQRAVAHLAPDFAGRADLAVEGLLVSRVDREGLVQFLAWTRRPPLLPTMGVATESGPGAASTVGARLPRWARAVAIVSPALTLTLFTLWVVDILPVAWPWVLLLLLQTWLARGWAKVLAPFFEGATSRSKGLRRHHALFAAWEAYGTDCPELRSLQAKLTDARGAPASESIRTLERWLDLAESRASMLHPFLALGLLWDVHIALGLERWRLRTGERVEEWFDALGELEALASLATLAHDQPGWGFPEVLDGPPAFEATALGHPLLADDSRRTSDISVDPPGRFVLITGSNMSGKSTLLRSIGLAAVLGQAGSVVCADSARMSPLRTFTSMRIQDSLTGGVSLFMAELLRLKALVDAADVPAGQPALLYLVDEVLQGTNSEERRVAARRIVKHLLSSNAIGAVTTHDLALHDDPALDPASTKVHFREHVDDAADEVLTFDYVLRPGLATSRNALKLLRLVGLPDADEPD
jgi:hypothetical protein